MEKKHRYLSFALILAVIILAHLLIVLLVRKSASAETSAPGGQTAATMQPDQKPKPPPAKPFRLNYRYASRDKIPGLPTGGAPAGMLVDLDSGYVLWEKTAVNRCR